MADDKRIELRKILRDAIRYRRTIQRFTDHPVDVKGLGLSTDLDPDRVPNPNNPNNGKSLEVQAVLEDANEAAREAAQALSLELGRLGYPTIERRHEDGDPGGTDALDTVIQREADSKRRRIRFTAGKNDVKLYKPKGT